MDAKRRDEEARRFVVLTLLKMFYIFPIYFWLLLYCLLNMTVVIDVSESYTSLGKLELGLESIGAPGNIMSV
uniref:Uncharacterized protein n=1 Tax=Arundo donax TaxID=35708 RepID=A0A0A9EN34_ARUDO